MKGLTACLLMFLALAHLAAAGDKKNTDLAPFLAQYKSSEKKSETHFVFRSDLDFAVVKSQLKKWLGAEWEEIDGGVSVGKAGGLIEMERSSEALFFKEPVCVLLSYKPESKLFELQLGEVKTNPHEGKALENNEAPKNPYDGSWEQPILDSQK